MTHASSEDEFADVEDSLGRVTLATWNRVRSSDELQDFITKRHSDVESIEL